MARNSHNDLPRNVLVIRFSALGDVAIAIPVLYSMCRAYPHTRFVMLTRPWPAGMLIERPANLVVVDAEVTTDYKGAAGMLRLAAELRKHYHIDAVADLHDVLRSWLIDASMRLHGIAVARIDKGRREKRALCKGRLHRQLASSHDRYVAVFERLGFDYSETFEGFSHIGSPKLPARDTGERWIAIAPFSQHKGKVYPMPLLEQVIGQVAAWPRVRIFLFGGGSQEKQELHRLALKYPHTLSMAELKHNFVDEFALMAACDVMVTMDSANMHMASLAGTPVVSIWGATHPYCGFMGWRQSPESAVQLDLDCRPCSVFGQRPCKYGDYRCMTGIKPETIVEKIKQTIA